MSDIKWMDGAVCYEGGEQWFASNQDGYLFDVCGGCEIFHGDLIESKNFKLNNLKIGDCISKSELDTEDKYNKAAEVFELFGYQSEVVYRDMIDCGSVLIDTHSEFCCVNIKYYDAKRVLTFNQLMAIGELKRLMNERESETQSKVSTPSNAIDQVKSPSHYQLIDGVESIEVIARSMTKEQWKGFCLGNMLKYRIRAGKKDDLQQDIGKANFYGELYEMHKGRCYE